MDVVLGAGSRYLDSRRADGEDLTAVLASMGYQYVSNRAELATVTGPRVWGMFADEAMAYEFDRQILHPDQPSLAEMTHKAIQILSRSREGFFLIVEGSKVDWANHANDPIGCISDLGAFDDAVGVALDFAEANGHTLVLAFADHDTGGMSLGSKASDATYSRLPVEALVNPLLPARLTGEGIGEALGSDRSEANIRGVMSNYYGIANLTSAEVALIAAAPAGSMNYVVGPMISSRSVIGWTTGGHVGQDLFLYSHGIDEPLGLIENTDIARICADAMGVDLGGTTRFLYAEAIPALEAAGATVFVDSTTDPLNRVLVAQKGTTTLRFPLDKNLMEVASKSVNATYCLQGLVVEAERTPARKIYLPQTGLMVARLLLMR
jgi:alkaline phosphatase